MSNWASNAIETLQKGEIAYLRPKGNSMKGRIEDGQKITLDPTVEPQVNDVVLCKVKGKVYVHLIKTIRSKGDNQEFQIGNNKGKINGWTRRHMIYGVVTKVED